MNVSCCSCGELDERRHPLRMKLQRRRRGRARPGSELGSHRLPTNIILHLLTLSDIQFLGSQCERCLQIVSIVISDVWPLARAENEEKWWRNRGGGGEEEEAETVKKSLLCIGTISIATTASFLQIRNEEKWWTNEEELALNRG